MKTTTRLLIFIAVIFAANLSLAQGPFTGKPQYQIEVRRADTLMGKIIVEMFPAIAPNHVRNWDSLVAIHFYDSLAFHRVIPGFMIQGGGPNSRSGPKSTWGVSQDDQQTVDAEFSSVSHQRGILSAARLGNDINSATSQFFICVTNQTSLDRQYSIYGRVINGMNIADSIVKSKRDGSDNPLVKITMFIIKLGSNDSSTAIPLLVSPSDGSSNGTAIKATLKWHKISDAMLYKLQVATDENFTNIFLDSSLRQIDTSAIVNKLVKGTKYYWRVLANNGGNQSHYSIAWSFTVETLSVNDAPNFENPISIYPNPINNNFTVDFNLQKSSTITVRIIDLLGNEVAPAITTKMFSAGKRQLTLERPNVASGIYYCQIQLLGTTITKKLVFK